MVWLNTKYFGIGKATSHTGKIFVVAYYYPPGKETDQLLSMFYFVSIVFIEHFVYYFCITSLYLFKCLLVFSDSEIIWGVISAE